VAVVSLLRLLASLLALTPSTPALRIVPAAPRQGQALIVSLERLPARSRAALSWDGRQYPIYALSDGWRGVIPIRIQERPGTHSVLMSYTSSGGERHSLRRAVSVGRTPVRTQRLTMARKTEKLYSYPGRKKELATVRRALLTETPRQFWNRDFLIPIHGRYSTWFGERRIRNGRVVGTHMGLDIAAPQGTPIRADADGRVRLSRALTMHGKTVVIDHGLGVCSIFLHQSALRCREGQLVHRGDVIGEVGMTGVATGPHVHWSVYVHGTAVSPLFWTKLPALH
jgi:murein DD-endopeptidase MepM/ murein hydrolase activator NlpD